ncbi:hypothetical protein B7Y94_06030 [Candidatus Saccharibacteria bacterium 32-49-12]|nr:MAG: hypothetical protein B7Y94_06030 [Candidatus Saccharibacteria bacterium 32-49-12]
MRLTNKTSRAFTLVEMLVVAPIVILAIGAFLTVTISITGEVIASRTTNVMTFEIQDALNRIEQDVKQSTTFLATSNIPAQGANNDNAMSITNLGDSNGPALILNMIATTGNPMSASSQYIALRDQPNPCASPIGNKPHSYNVVYFVRNESLWRRVIMYPSYTNTTSFTCQTPWQQPTCTPEYMAAQTGSVFCKTRDMKLVDGVKPDGFSVKYYSGQSNSTANGQAYSSDNSVRSTALAASSSVLVELRSIRSAAGREIDNQSQIRISRLATNAAALALEMTPTTPAAPRPTSQNEIGAKATFTWPNVPGATGYTFQYNIDGGTWQTGFTNQPTRRYTVTAPSNDRTINARVLAINSAGSSAYGTTSAEIPIWEPLLLTADWVPYSTSFSTPSYTKTKSGVVLVKGLVKNQNVFTGPITIATLPEGYRPQDGALMFGNSKNANAAGRTYVYLNGNVQIVDGHEGWTSLDNIMFLPAGGTYNMTTLTPLNGWTQYGGGYAPIAYSVGAYNRVFLQGLMKTGTTTFGTQIAALPTVAQPSMYMHLGLAAYGWGQAGIEGRSSITPNGIMARGPTTGTSWLSITSNYMNKNHTAWTNAPLVNGWVNYATSTYESAQYTKTADGLVTLKGLVASGTANRIMTLPVGYRPKETLLLTVAANDAYARVDVRADGGVDRVAGSNVWLSLSGITFLAEQ